MEVTSTALIERASVLDGQQVVYTGEVIGDVLPRGDHAWVNVSDGVNAIGVWLDASQFQQITMPGRYGQTGDRLAITAVFHRACPEHGGDLDLHAVQIEVIARGHDTPATVSGTLALGAVLFAALDGVLLVLWLRKRKIRHQG